MNHISPDQKKTLRKTRTVTNAVKAVVYQGNNGGPRMAVQFNKDVQLYGLWEALLYVEEYEREGYYAVNTAEKALNAALMPDEDYQLA